jgi:hypothetical protein
VKTLGTAREIAIGIEVVKFGAIEVCHGIKVRGSERWTKPAPLFFNNGYSKFEHTQRLASEREQQ